jgi:transketolase C-terminal domain/subunit
VHSGLGSVIADKLVAMGLRAPLIKLGIKQYPFAGNSDEVYKWAELDSISLIKKIKANL